MKRQFHASSPPSSPLPMTKRPRMFVASPTPPPEIDQNMDEEEPIVELVEESQNDDDDDIIEVEELLNIDRICHTVILVSDSDDESDDQGIDVTDEMFSSLPPPPPPITITAPISPAWSEEIEIVQELMTMEENANDDDLEIVADDINQELIDLTEDEPPLSPLPIERKTSTDVQQCPVCLETLSHLQRTGIHLIITRCRHVMCTLCSRQLLLISPRCPLCRENLNSTTLMPYCILI